MRRSLSRHRSKNLFKPTLKYKYTKKFSLKKFAKEDDVINLTSPSHPNTYTVQKKIGYVNKDNYDSKKSDEEPEIDFIIFYSQELIDKYDIIEDIGVDGTFDSVPNVKGVYQLMTILAEKKNEEKVIATKNYLHYQKEVNELFKKKVKIFIL